MSNYVYEEEINFNNLLDLKMRFYGKNPNTNELEEISLTSITEPGEITPTYMYMPHNTSILWDFLYKEEGSGTIKHTTLTFGLSLTQRTTNIFTEDNLNNIKAAVYINDVNLGSEYFQKKFEFSNFFTKTNTEINTGSGISILNSIYIEQGQNAVLILLTFTEKSLLDTININTPNISAAPWYMILMS